MVTYRTFRNSDPPRLLALWHGCGFGRGAAEGFTTDAFEVLVFSQPYFDPADMILAVDGEPDDERVVGFVHVGYGSNEDGSSLDHTTGVVCAIAVRADRQMQGIGGELLARGIARLRERGATTILAGPGPGADPFYLGMYGGLRPAGFLESDPAAGPFLAKHGFEPRARHVVYGRDLENARDPVNFRLVTVRRKTQLAVGPETDDPSWWWTTRFGRLDTARFLLLPKGGDPLAWLTVVGLDLYVQKWNAQAVGLFDVVVPDDERRNGYAQALILEVCRRFREELVGRVEVHVAEENEIGARLLESCAFEAADRGIVYELAAGERTV